MKNWLVYLSTLICALHFTAKVQAAGDVVFADDFAGGLEKWEDARGTPENWQIVDGQLEVKIESSFTVSQLVPRAEYWSLSIEPYEFSLDFTPLQGADRNLTFAVFDTKNWLGFHFVAGKIYFSKIENGREVFQLVQNYSLDNGRTHQVKITHNHDQVQLEIDQVVVFDHTDPALAYGGGTISLVASTGSVVPALVRFDNVVVRRLTIDSKFTHYKQTDPTWANEEYDSASAWAAQWGDAAQTGIEAWGCALTSAAMILKFHGINQLPNNQPLDPGSLNEWLKQQPDGYIGEGLVNWVAITRLTWQMSNQLQTPKLEYLKHTAQPLESAQAELENSRPVILQIPGHFLVADAAINHPTTGQTDLSIKDPWYDYQFFSEHQKPLVSTRSFLPSQTDLSYLIIATNPKVGWTMIDPSGVVLPSQQTTTDFLINPNLPDQQTSSLRLLELPKPQSGQYQLTLTTNDLQPTPLSIFSYNAQAELTNHSQTVISNQSGVQFEFEYQADGSSQIKRKKTWSELQVALEELWQSGELTHYSSLIILKRLIAFAQSSPPDLQHRYPPLIEQTVANIETDFSPLGYQFFIQELQAVAASL